MRRVVGTSLALLLAACGGSSPPPTRPASNADQPAEEDEGEVVILGALVGDGTAEPRPPRAPRPPPPVPADRAPAADPPAAPDLAEAERLYAEALTVPIGGGEVSADTETAVARLNEEVQAASAAVGEALARYEPFYADEELGPIARTRSGDLLDAYAARVAAANLPLPRHMRDVIAEASPDVRAEVERVLHERVGEAMARQAAPVFCLAVDHYRAAGTERARAQLARYGAAFVSQCPDDDGQAPPD